MSFDRTKMLIKSKNRNAVQTGTDRQTGHDKCTVKEASIRLLNTN